MGTVIKISEGYMTPVDNSIFHQIIERSKEYGG